MRRALTSMLPEPHWPEGIGLVPFAEAVPADIHALMTLAYAGGGGSVPDFATWWQATSTDPAFDPALCLVADNALGEVVGLCLCWTTSFVKDLTVHPQWRQRGVATALLQTAFRALANRGHEAVDLKVEVDNPSGAIALYRSLGFEPVPQR